MKKVQITKVLDILDKESKNWDVPVAELIQVQTKDPFKVLLATILSARSRDEVTAKVAARLYKKVNEPNDLLMLSVKEIEELIFPIGFYKNKAKYLHELPKVLDSEFDGVIPDEIEEMVKLPGVGRKTANLVRSVGFDKPAICVDVHVHRIMNRFGYIKTKDVLDTEMTLRSKVPEEYWQIINRVLVALGQNICAPITPKCSVCPVYKHCNRVGVEKSR